MRRTPLVHTRRELLLAAGGAGLALATPLAWGKEPRRLAAVTADLEAHVALIDLATGRVVRRVRTLRDPRSIESFPGGVAIVGHTALGALTVLHTREAGRQELLRGLGEPRYVASGADEAFVTDSHGGRLIAVDPLRARVVGAVDVRGPARHLTLHPARAEVWTALGTKAGRIAVVDVSSPKKPKLIRLIEPPRTAHDVVVAPDGRVWVSSGDARSLWIYDPDGRRPLVTLSADLAPQHVTFSRTRAFVASGDSGTVRVHRLDGTLVDVTEVPAGSYNVAIGRGRVVTPSLDRGTIAVLDSAGRRVVVRRIARSSHDACVLDT